MWPLRILPIAPWEYGGVLYHHSKVDAIAWSGDIIYLNGLYSFFSSVVLEYGCYFGLHILPVLCLLLSFYVQHED